MASALGDLELMTRLLDTDSECIHLRVRVEYFPMFSDKNGGTSYQWELGWHVSAHQVARKFGHEHIFKLLMERSPASTRLLAACWLGDEGLVTSLLRELPDMVAGLTDAERRQLPHAARNNESEP